MASLHCIVAPEQNQMELLANCSATVYGAIPIENEKGANRHGYGKLKTSDELIITFPKVQNGVVYVHVVRSVLARVKLRYVESRALSS